MVKTIVPEGAREKAKWAPVKTDDRLQNIFRELEAMPNFTVKVAAQTGAEFSQPPLPKS